MNSNSHYILYRQTSCFLKFDSVYETKRDLIHSVLCNRSIYIDSNGMMRDNWIVLEGEGSRDSVLGKLSDTIKNSDGFGKRKHYFNCPTWNLDRFILLFI